MKLTLKFEYWSDTIKSEMIKRTFEDVNINIVTFTFILHDSIAVDLGENMNAVSILVQF